MNENSERLEVYSAIADITGELSKIGIAKDSQNISQKYKFRGIDAVLQTLSPLLAKHRLIVLPRVVAHEQNEYKTSSGGRMVNTILDVDFDFVSAKDGSKHTVRTVGEAMDSADKSSNKAMSAAYKYAAFLTFCIPVDGEEDADASSPSVVPKEAAEKPKPQVAGPNVSHAERVRNANLFLARGLDFKITPTTPEFAHLKSIAGPEFMDWVLRFEQLDDKVPMTYQSMVEFFSSNVLAKEILTDGDLNDAVNSVFKEQK